MTTSEQILQTIERNIDSVKHSFPWTHDDDVKLETLEDLYREIKADIQREKTSRCRKCVNEMQCSKHRTNCPDYKRDAPDGGSY